MTQSRVCSVVVLVALTASAMLFLTACATSSDETAVGEAEGAEDGVDDESANSSVSDSVFIENDTKADIGEMI